MKIFIALALLLAVAQASVTFRKVQASVTPRDIKVPLSELNPRHTAAEWVEIYRQQEAQPEVVPNYKPGTVPQDENAGTSNFDSKIVGGSTAAASQFPWQVSITMDGSYFCGGSIISTTWVLTAGHCVDAVKSFRVVAGTLTPDGGASGSVALTSRTSILHERYNSRTIVNDIGLVQLPSALTLSSVIGTIRLPKRSQVGTTFAGETVRISGWGLTSDSATSIAPSLRWADLSVITNTVCAATYGTTISAGNICTSGAGGRSTCQGDSGGPLAIQESDGKWTEVGIVSFGSSAGCDKGYPDAFTRVTNFLDWIETNSGINISA